MKIFGRKSAGRAEARPVFSRVSGVGAVASVLRGAGARGVSGQRHRPARGAAGGGRGGRGAVGGVDPGCWRWPRCGRRAGAARDGGGAAAAARQCLCPAAERRGGRWRELFALRPERVTVEADAGGWPVAYRYGVGRADGAAVGAEGRAAGGGAYQGVPSARRSLRAGLPGRGGGGGRGAQCGGAVEQGAARQCGAAVGGAGL